MILKTKSVTNKCEFFIEKDGILLLPKFLAKEKLGNKYAIITDKKIEKIHGTRIMALLKKHKIKAEIFSVAAGETSKKLQTIETLAEALLKKGFDRKDAILSLGGGVVGDLAGFLASVYMRGIPYIQIPTNLLAMVDSAIGGKTGVDLPSGKNLIGTTNQPKAIFIDINFLKTLPENQIRNGLAEIIKYGVIKDKGLFKYIEKNLAKIIEKDEKALKHIIEKSVNIKAKVVEKDVHEKGERMLLNYGHTFGHAIEQMSGYKLLHGYAIAIGMVMANKMAVEKNLLSQKNSDRIKALFQAAELPVTTMFKPTMKDLSKDKKKHGNHINFILPKKIGKAIIVPVKCS